jgi:predicted nucleic acid-binding Zn ribbon protein
MVRYRFECERCGWQETRTFKSVAVAPKHVACPACFGTMVRLQPSPAMHFHPTRTKGDDKQ